MSATPTTSQIVVFGAGGITAAHVVRQASAAGHKVLAVARNPAKIVFFQGLPGVTLITGDVLDPASVESALATDGTTHCVFAASGKSTKTPVQFAEHQGLAKIAAVCAKRDIKLVVISSMLVTRKNRCHPIRLFLNTVLVWGVMDAKIAGEDAVREHKDLRYCIIRPSGLQDKAPSEFMWELSQGDKASFGRYSISRQDVAKVVIAALFDEGSNRVTFEIMGPDPKSTKPAATDGMFNALQRD